MARILAVEDDELYGFALEALLSEAGYAFVRVAGLEQARAHLAASHFDLILLDVSLPDGHGPCLIPEVRRHGGPPIVCLTAYADVPAAVEAMRAGAHDYVEKSARPEQLLERVRGALPPGLPLEDDPRVARELLGKSKAMGHVRGLVGLASHSNTTVLVSGETGTGKSHVARLIHRHSPRSGRPFETVDCAAMAESLAESQLFGHERGAFTGAIQRHIGAIERAANGTLFFDEVADLPLSAQGKLLRVLEDRIFSRVGGDRELPVEARVIGATRRDLAEMVAEGRFREDLYFRLTVLEIALPPLRDRRDDIPGLLSHFLRRADAAAAAGPSEELLSALQAHPFRGNVRELRNVVERMALISRARGRAATAAEIGLVSRPAAETAPDPETDAGGYRDETDALKSQEIGLALVASGGRIGEAARNLGISRHALRRRLQKIQDGPELSDSYM